MYEKKDIPCSEYRPNILIAQNDEDDLKLLEAASIKYGKYDAVYAQTGQEIIDNVNNHCFDTIILGLKFPDITGATIAYLVHQFDPLVTIGFLTVYKNNILVAAANDLHLRFWDKNEKFKDLDLLCCDIYDLAVEISCDDEKRIIRREYRKPLRDEYLKYHKLTIPHSLAKVVIKHQERE